MSASLPVAGCFNVFATLCFGSVLAFIVLMGMTLSQAYWQGIPAARYRSEQLWAKQKTAFPPLFDRLRQWLPPVQSFDWYVKEQINAWQNGDAFFLPDDADQVNLSLPVLVNPVLKTIGLRVLHLVFSLPLLLLLLIAGWLEGRLQRQFRCYRGVRDSASLFHRYRCGFHRSWQGIWLVYLANPWVLPLNGLLLLAYPALAMQWANTVRHFKKIP